MHTCAVRHCRDKLRTDTELRLGICDRCRGHWFRFNVPVAGYISTLDLRPIAKDFLAEIDPTKAEIAEALRILRGMRHPTGPWSARPAYRIAPLLYGRRSVKLPHLLVGRRRGPTLESLGLGLVHYHLANTVIGTRSTYSHYLAGASFYCRRACSAPSASDVPKGGAKTSGYHLHIGDLSLVGLQVLKAAEKLGIPRQQRWVSDRITSLYHEGLASGRYHPPILVPYNSFGTKAGGDHPLDHLISDRADVHPAYLHTYRRANGMVRGLSEYPAELDVPPETALEVAARKRQERQANLERPTMPAPDTSWLFNC